MTPSVKVLERLTMVAPLGLRFRDVVAGSFVGDGLNVVLYEPNRPTTKVEAVANLSGIYVVHHAPGLRDFENGTGDADFWNNLPRQKTFVIAVTDVHRRFLPFQFNAELPTRGIFNWTSPLGPSPPSAFPSIPLYSSPVRDVTAGMAVVRADLWDAARNVPAASAVLEAYTNSQLVARGLADEKGRTALIFPILAPRPFTILSPPGSPLASTPTATGLPLTEQVWPITFRAMYAPIIPAPDLVGEFGPEPQLPNLHDILSQREGILWADEALTEPLGEVSLRYGRELVLKSRPTTSSPPAPLSVLFVTPVGSPP